MDSLHIQIEALVYGDVMAHAKSLLPNEACGYLAGRDGVISRFYPMTNLDNRSDHFTMEPKEQFQAVKSARAEGLSILSVYHSHPETPARLSSEDIELLNDPLMVYIIVSLMDDQPDMKAYRLKKSDEKVEIYRVDLQVLSAKQGGN